MVMQGTIAFFIESSALERKTKLFRGISLNWGPLLQTLDQVSSASAERWGICLRNSGKFSREVMLQGEERFSTKLMGLQSLIQGVRVDRRGNASKKEEESLLAGKKRRQD